MVRLISYQLLQSHQRMAISVLACQLQCTDDDRRTSRKDGSSELVATSTTSEDGDISWLFPFAPFFTCFYLSEPIFKYHQNHQVLYTSNICKALTLQVERAQEVLVNRNAMFGRAEALLNLRRETTLKAMALRTSAKYIGETSETYCTRGNSCRVRSSTGRNRQRTQVDTRESRPQVSSTNKPRGWL